MNLRERMSKLDKFIYSFQHIFSVFFISHLQPLLQEVYPQLEPKILLLKCGNDLKYMSEKLQYNTKLTL